MATGYTYPVAEGEITTFPEFAMSCARAFGACIEMRDEPADAAIPEEFKPGTYHHEALAKAQNRLLELYAMTPKKIAAGAATAHRTLVEAEQSYQATMKIEDERLKAMIEKVKAWQPPTKDHAGLKTFMLDQLQGSLHKAKPSALPKAQEPEAWHAAEIDRAKREVEYHSEQYAKDVERARERTEWVRHLRESLKPKSAAAA